jgi:hypothetical protein
MNLIPKPNLNIDFCSHEAAVFSCTKFHYSKCVPVGKMVKYGVWENNTFKGCLIFSRGANKGLGVEYNLKTTEVCELTRIALNDHFYPVSKILSYTLKNFNKNFPGIKLIYSYADKAQGHHGGIYQATNWIYNGASIPADEYIYKSKRYHGRAFRKIYGSHKNYMGKGLKIVKGSSKHRYLMCFDNCLKTKIQSLPYPKRAKKLDSGDQPEQGGAVPTCSLQKQKERI